MRDADNSVWKGGRGEGGRSDCSSAQFSSLLRSLSMVLIFASVLVDFQVRELESELAEYRGHMSQAERERMRATQWLDTER